MSDLKPYQVTIWGLPHTLLLSDGDAERQGLLNSTAEEPAAKTETVEGSASAKETPKRPGRKPLPRDENGRIIRDKG